MKNLLPILLLPLFIFIACGDDDVDKCNDLTDNYDAANAAWDANQNSSTCNAVADALHESFSEGCEEAFDSFYPGWTTDSVATWRTDNCSDL